MRYSATGKLVEIPSYYSLLKIILSTAKQQANPFIIIEQEILSINADGLGFIFEKRKTI